VNARIPNLRIVPVSKRSLVVEPFGFRITAVYEFDAGEAPVLFGPNPCPGTPPSAELLACYVNGQDILPALGSQQRARIETLLLEQCE
jgi:hypothetical protein